MLILQKRRYQFMFCPNIPALAEAIWVHTRRKQFNEWSLLKCLRMRELTREEGMKIPVRPTISDSDCFSNMKSSETVHLGDSYEVF